MTTNLEGNMQIISSSQPPIRIQRSTLLVHGTRPIFLVHPRISHSYKIIWVPITYEARTLHFFIMFGVRYRSVLVSDTDTTHYVLYFEYYRYPHIHIRIVSGIHVGIGVSQLLTLPIVSLTLRIEMRLSFTHSPNPYTS